MRVRFEWRWEKLDSDTYRAKVIGGWIVKSGYCPEDRSVDLSMVFVPDIDHRWSITEPISVTIEQNKINLAKKFESKPIHSKKAQQEPKQ